MPRLRKMLTEIDAPYLQMLMRAMVTQSTQTISEWCIAYAQQHILPLWEQRFPEDARLRAALDAAHNYLAGELELHGLKQKVVKCREAARAAEGIPVAQAAARAIDAACSSVYNCASSLGIALYGVLALAYNQAGTEASWSNLEPIAAEECNKMAAALHEVAVDDEPNPAKLDWNC